MTQWHIPITPAEALVSADEAHAIAGVLEMQRRSIETEQLEQRIAALEQARDQ